MRDTVVILPTYNEAENLRELLPRLKQYDVDILVVDDSPNTTTQDVAESLGALVLRRDGKKGLSSATLDGIEATTQKNIVIMDADLQHPPEVIPSILEALNKHEVVVASRCIPGGRYEGFPLGRRIISCVAKLLAIPLAPRIKDNGSNFLAFRRSILDGAGLRPTGYKLGLEVFVKCKYNSSKEVPYTFRARKRGESKLSHKAIFDHLIQLGRLYLYKFRLLRFGMVGALGAVIGFPILYSLTEFVGLHYIVSAIIAIVCASTSNYFFNNLWTFREKRRRGKGHIAGWLNYEVLSAGGDGAYLGLLALLTSVLGIWYILSAAISVVTIFVFKYLFANRVIWRTKRDAA